MHPLTRYYIHHAGGGGGSSGGGGPIYSLPPYFQRGHGIGDYFGPLFRAIKALFFSGARYAGKALGRAAVRTGGKILSAIADNPHMDYKDIISKNVLESFQNLRSTMMGGGRKRKRRAPSSTKCPSKRRKRATSKRRKTKRPSKRRVPKHRDAPPTKKRHFCLTQYSNQTVMAEEPSFPGTEFDLFSRTPKQDGCVETTETKHKPIASVDQTDIEILIPGDSDTYIDPNLILFIRGKLVNNDGSDLAETDNVAGIKNRLIPYSLNVQSH